MNQSTAIKLFQDRNVRVIWDEEQEKYYFSIVDVVAILTESDYQNARNYWKVLKHRLSQEGASESVTNCNQLKMKAADGKYYKTDVADTEELLRIIQSVPSPKAEPFKLWLAKVGRERLDELADPEITINRALQTYLDKGYSENWVNQRLKTIEVRKDLTNEWERVGIKKGLEFAILTDEITKSWADMTTKEYKKLKDLRKENLRDNMTNVELVLNMLAEVSTTEISKERNPKTFEESKTIAKQGGEVAKNARQNIEKQLGHKVITSKNAKNLKRIEKKEEN
ncbi:MAG: Bro-N domain-containing protein [Alphaproteobacteria bacterium]